MSDIPAVIKDDAQDLMLSVGAADMLVDALLKYPQVASSVVHHFGPGLYIREINIPAGTFAVGHYQRFEHLNVMLKGKVRMLNEDGTTTDLEAPLMYIGKPGRKIGTILEDMTWQTIYATTETDIDKLEETLLIMSDHYVSGEDDRKTADNLSHEADREDYRLVLEQSGFTEAEARRQSEDPTLLTDMPPYCSPYRISDSPIEGKGFFITTPLDVDAVIGLARYNGKKTPLGRYTNHSKAPNAKPVLLESGDMAFVATRHIIGCSGGNKGEEITIDYRETLTMNGIHLRLMR